VCVSALIQVSVTRTSNTRWQLLQPQTRWKTTGLATRTFLSTDAPTQYQPRNAQQVKYFNSLANSTQKIGRDAIVNLHKLAYMILDLFGNHHLSRSDSVLRSHSVTAVCKCKRWSCVVVWHYIVPWRLLSFFPCSVLCFVRRKACHACCICFAQTKVWHSIMSSSKTSAPNAQTLRRLVWWLTARLA